MPARKDAGETKRRNTGRFLSQDSYKGNAYEPWTQHLYTYCGNDPVNMVDPTGHRPAVGCNGMDDDGNVVPPATPTNTTSGSSPTTTSTTSPSPTTPTTTPTTTPSPATSSTTTNTDPFSILDNLLGTGGAISDGYSKVKTIVQGIWSDNGYLKTLEGLTIDRPYQFLEPISKYCSYAAVVCTGVEIGKTWTEENGNTTKQRIIKSVIQTAGAVGEYGLGSLSAGLVTLGLSTAGIGELATDTEILSEVGIPGMVGGAIDVVAGVGINVAGTILINKAEDQLYNWAGIN